MNQFVVEFLLLNHYLDYEMFLKRRVVRDLFFELITRFVEIHRFDIDYSRDILFDR